MSIQGITDKQRLPRIAKIRLGEKDPARGYPKATDHFNFKDAPELEELFGANCKEIYPIVIPDEDEQVWMPTSLSAYGAGSGLFCRCSDTETAIRVHKGLDVRKDFKGKDGKTKSNPGYNKPADPQGWAYMESQKMDPANASPGTMFELPCPGAECPYAKRDICKPLGRLFIVVVNGPKFGCYEISTTSINSIRNVLSSARYIKQTAGRITGIPLALKLVPLQVQPDGKAKTVFVLELEFRDGGIRRLMSLQHGSHPQGLIGAPDAPDDVPSDLYRGGGQDAPFGPSAPGTEPDEFPINEPLNDADDIFGPIDDEPAETVSADSMLLGQENAEKNQGKEAGQARQRGRAPARQAPPSPAPARPAPQPQADRPAGGDDWEW